MNYCIVLAAILAFSQVLNEVTAGNGLPQGNGDPAKDSPQYIYMERLRKVARTMTESVETTGDDAHTPGTLLATSFKDTCKHYGTFLCTCERLAFFADTNGGQIGGGGVSSSIDLHFTVPQQTTNAIGSQDESRPISKSELWLFPNFNVPKNERWYEVSLGFVFTLEGFNRPVEAEVGNILWRGSDDCIMVDLTPQTKIIDRKLKRRGLNETLVHVRVTVHHREEYHGPTPHVEEWQNTCSSLSHRTTNTSFLVVKYFSDETEVSEDTSRSRRRVENLPQSNSSLPEFCSLIQFKVRLQEVFGNFITSPTEPVDIGACVGKCDISLTGELFSKRAMLKDRMRSLPSIPKEHFTVNCVAQTVVPLNVLIHDDREDSYFLVKLPIKANTCGCR